MPKNNTAIPAKAKSVPRQIIVSLVMVGFVLGMYRWLGKGAQIWDPGWWTNAQQTMSTAIPSAREWVTGVINKHPVENVKLPTPSPTKILPKP